MIVVDLINGPLDKKQVELEQAHAYELFQLASITVDGRQREQWAYYRIHPLYSDCTSKAARVDYQSHASRVLVAKPGSSGRGSRKHSFVGTLYRKADARYLFVTIMDDKSPCVIARKESLARVVEYA